MSPPPRRSLWRARACFALAPAARHRRRAGGDRPLARARAAARARSRAGAAAGRLHADLLPAGFTSGENESGRGSRSSLPDCLRWDYAEPYPKSFLLCGARAYSWDEGEPRASAATSTRARAGPRPAAAARSTSSRERYPATQPRAAATTRARARRRSGRKPRSRPRPRPRPGGERPTALDYRDREGNLTRFELRRLARARSRRRRRPFSPPPAIDWQSRDAPAAELQRRAVVGCARASRPTHDGRQLLRRRLQRRPPGGQATPSPRPRRRSAPATTSSRPRAELELEGEEIVARVVRRVHARPGARGR